ncbi:hypothetical protein NMY22_g7768 [Coprinellus aureogranulatus]|nr:hypothetical protein NMY22_g7768 [Coprinellus aureogranulatus]
MSRDPDYRGHQFLVLRDPKGKPLPPAYANGGAYLRHVNGDPKMCARFCRAILNHAPIGEYYLWFNIPEDPDAVCSQLATGTRSHLSHMDWTTPKIDPGLDLDFPAGPASIMEPIQSNLCPVGPGLNPFKPSPVQPSPVQYD